VPTETENIAQEQPLVRHPDSKSHLKTVALRAYSSQKKQPVGNDRIVQLLPMVARIAQRMAGYLKPPLSLEDLVSAGTVGLIKAARNYDPSQQAEFRTYAFIRIKGAILDELRHFSLLPQNISKQARKALLISRQIAEQTGACPTDDELAEKLGITVDKLYETFESIRAQYSVSINQDHNTAFALSDILPSVNTPAPDKQLERKELIEMLTKAIKQLPARQREIILLYYQQHLTMKQIAQVLNITESRVSQLHAKIIFNLAVKLR